MITNPPIFWKLPCVIALIVLALGLNVIPLFAQGSCASAYSSCNASAVSDEQDCIADAAGAGQRHNCVLQYQQAKAACTAAYNACLTPPLQGYINPKYVVVGVTYAPPGASSFVQYTNTTSVGNTTAINNSFTNNVGFSVSVSKGFNIPEVGIKDGGAGVKLTATSSTDYTEGSNSSLTTSISKASTVSYITPGTPTFSPVNSDYDFIWIWLNPELLFTVTPASGSTKASIQWNGYGFDGKDPASGLPPASGPYYGGPDVIEVQVGCLNGHFSCPSTLTWLSGIQGPGSYVTSGTLARSWASAANNYQWASGEVPGFSFEDVCQILTFDPLAYTPSQCTKQNDYALLDSLPSTTSDGRFTRLPYPPNVIQYPVGGATEQYTTVQTNTKSVASGASNTIKQGFSISVEFGGSFLGLFSSTTTLTETQTLTWNYSWLDTITTSNSLTNELSITGPPDPPPGYYGPVQFIGYQDNLFGTFAFAPVL